MDTMEEDSIGGGFLAGVSNLVGLPVDKLRYIFLLILSFPLAYFLRAVLHPRLVSSTTRYLFNVFVGILFAVFCFGMQTLYLLGMVAVGYVLLLVLPAKTVQRYSMAWSTVCITSAHLYRMYTDYGGFHLDFTGPLMLLVQRVTYVAFSLHDGLGSKDATLTAEQRRLKLVQIPSVLEYFSYNFSFLTFLAGPTVAFKEYQDFVTGENYAIPKESKFTEAARDPSPFLPAVTMLLLSVAHLAVFMNFRGIFTDDWLLSPDLGILTRIVVMMCFCYVIRTQYYFIWFLADSICITSGLSFSGYDKEGKPIWDLTKAIDTLAFEFGTNLRQMTLAWNLPTQIWLRRVCYERASFMPLAYTWIYSALWHGFYPGYYLCFVLLFVGTMAARNLRRLLWHRFQSPPVVKRLYDFSSYLVSAVLRDFCGTPMVLYLIGQSLLVWSYFYYVPVIVAVLLALLPAPKRRNEHAHSSKLKE